MDRHKIIASDYFMSHGLEGVFEYHTRYAEVEKWYAELSASGTPEQLEFIEAVALHVPDIKNVHWSSQFRWTEDFYAAHGHFPKKSDTAPNSQRLYRWITNMRKRKSALSDKQVALLDSISPDWKVTKSDEWECKFGLVKDFVKSNQRFPKTTGSEDEKKLRRWLETQKRVSPRMPAERKAILDSGLPGWDESADDRWYAVLEEVVAFYNKNNRAPRKSRGDKEEKRLGDWVFRARKNYREQSLESEQIAALNAQVPGWSEGFGDQWESMLQETISFYLANKRLPKAEDPGAKRLNTWIKTQRESFGSNLSPERIALLDANLPDWNESLDDRWNSKLSQLVAYVAQHHDFPSDSKKAAPSLEIADLGSWFQVQKRDLKNSKIRADLKDELDSAIPNCNDSWKFKLYKTQEHTKLMGRIPPTKSNPYEASGRWVARQRRDFKAGKLTADKVSALNAVIPDWNPTV